MISVFDAYPTAVRLSSDNRSKKTISVEKDFKDVLLSWLIHILYIILEYACMDF